MESHETGQSKDVRDLGRLRWRCRRGLKELDVLLRRYVEEEFRDAPAAHQHAFRELLEASDLLIYSYCLGQEPPPTVVLAALIERLTGTRSTRAVAADHGC